MTPIHHHFEMKAWSETKIMVRFWILTRDPLRLRVRALLPLLLPVLPRRRMTILVLDGALLATRSRELGDDEL